MCNYISAPVLEPFDRKIVDLLHRMVQDFHFDLKRHQKVRKIFSDKNTEN